ncbi:alpha/beta fold hydrolase, partial [Thioclava sp. BHET1]
MQGRALCPDRRGARRHRGGRGDLGPSGHRRDDDRRRIRPTLVLPVGCGRSCAGPELTYRGEEPVTPDQILSFVMLVLSGGAPDGFPGLQNGGQDLRYPVKIAACSAAVPPLDVEGKTVVCGTVNLPESYAKPNGRRIDLQFAVLKARSEAPQKDAMVYLHGGPGSRSVPEMQFYDATFDTIREDRDIVLFDQRASGLSDATVTCFDTLGANVFALAGKAKTEGDPLATCLEELKTKGVDLQAYNTTSNAQDVRAIMSALGYPRYNAYGGSYGTKLGQELMRSAPEGLRAIVLDSVAPVFSRSYDTNTGTIDKAVGSIVDRCMAQASC